MVQTSEGRRWLDRAAAGIRSRPDREAVRAELEAHLEDKTADLVRIFPDLGRQEAERQAVEQMGDAEEIGKELARIHKPWLGYLWRASQITLGIVLAVGVCEVLVAGQPGAAHGGPPVAAGHRYVPGG